jgi:uncharacterized repeat protein (TIGR01451 family)
MLLACVAGQWSPVNLPPGPQGPQGPQGPHGDAGPAGAQSLVALVPIPAGFTCPAGGTEVEVGLDKNGDGVLEPNEVQQTAVICNPSSTGSADLGVSAAGPGLANVGATFSVTFVLANNGPQQATGVQVSAAVPVGVSFVSATLTQGTYDSASGLWVVGAMGVGSSATLTGTFTLVSPNPQTFTATVAHEDQTDPNPANNVATATVVAAQADLAVQALVPGTPINVGQTFTSQFVVNNMGPDPATGVTLSVPIPAGATFVSATPSQGTFVGANGVWVVGGLGVGGSASLTIATTLVSPTGVQFVASVSHSDQFDPNVINNMAAGTVSAATADLSVKVVVQQPSVAPGSQFTITYQVFNSGPQQATNVVISVATPDPAVAFVSASPSVGTFSSVSGVWSVGNVDPGGVQTLVVQYTEGGTSGSVQKFGLSVAHSDQFDPSTPDNNASDFVKVF